ncbi:MAG TPA: hydrogenase maturation nickel metallochaperone HypA [Bacillota bacterium]|nr:hydrogenase maturation nickel metallochaperone HypA [Bacillota bacterium]
MHELSLATSILDVAAAQLAAAGRTRLLRVEVAVGELAAVLPDNLAFCFEVLAEDRPALAGAHLDVQVRPLMVRCRDCGGEAHPPRPVMRCPACGSSRVEVSSGQELEIVALEVE